MPNNNDPSFRGYKAKGLTGRIQAAIDAEANLSVEELAEEFHVTQTHVRSTLRFLNRKQSKYYSVGHTTGKNGHQGKIVNIYKKQNHLREVVNRQDRNILAPRLEHVARQIEQAVERFPHMADEFQALLLDKAARIAAIKDSLNANRRHSYQPTQARLQSA
jgi:predicted ArsR family transcriptional regulator